MSHHLLPGEDAVEIRFSVEPELHGMRCDHFLKRKIERLSRTKIQRIIDTQLIGPGGRKMKAHSPVSAGDVLIIRRPLRPEPAAPRDFTVCFEDDSLLVVDKPALLAMHPTAKYHRNTLTAVLAERYPDLKLYTAHRLDRETSGLVLIAKSQKMAAKLKIAFEKRRVQKTYLAIVRGVLEKRAGRIDLPIGLATGEKLTIKMVPRALESGGLASVTDYVVTEARCDHSLVEVSPRTGRQHQIRVHFAAIGHPLVGDKLYLGGDELFMRHSDGTITDEERATLGMERHALHAHRLELEHPLSGEPLAITADLPADMQQFWKNLDHSKFSE